MKRIIIIFFVCILSFISTFSQSNQAMKELEANMKPLVDLVFDAPTDNERFNANEKLLVNLEEVLSMSKSFSYPFDGLKRISILKSPDNRFRIFTWAVIAQDGTFENFGFVQSLNENSGEYEVYKLTDRSEEIFNPNEAKCDNANWFGAVYYDLIQLKDQDRTYYTLLGFDGNSIYTKRKIIEPINFKGRSSQPEFGASVFFKERDRKRFVFEYNPETSFVLKWDNQYYENKAKPKNNPISALFKRTSAPNIQADKNIPPDPSTVIFEQMIVYEKLEPMYEGMENMPQFFVGSGFVNGFKFERGRWRFIEGVLPRNDNPKKGLEPKRKREGSEQPMYIPNKGFKKISK